MYYSQHIKKSCKCSEDQTDKETVPTATDFRKTKASEYNSSKLMINHEGTKTNDSLFYATGMKFTSQWWSQASSYFY